MSTLSTHVLDTAMGKPAHGVDITLERQSGNDWSRVGGGVTNDDGRVKDLLAAGESMTAGVYRLRFAVESYFQSTERESFYPYADVVFRIADGEEHYHVPLLISGWGFSTYRGS